MESIIPTGIRNYNLELRAAIESDAGTGPKPHRVWWFFCLLVGATGLATGIVPVVRRTRAKALAPSRASTRSG